MDAVDLFDRCEFPSTPGPLSLGVSGGADSTAMALLAAHGGLEFTIWHVHHGLRPESDAEAVVVEKLASQLGAPFELREVALAAGGDLEARARAARYEALPDDVCVGHTADDRAETVLLNLFRGAGLAGVAAPFDRVRRPILGLRRSETQALCASSRVAGSNIAVVDDPMNHDPAFARVAIREHLLPDAAERLGRDLVPLINRHADLIADALAVVRLAAADLDPTDVVALRAAPRAVAGEVLRQWIRAETGDEHPVDAASIERVMDVVNGVHVATEVVGGHRVARTAGRLRVDR